MKSEKNDSLGGKLIFTDEQKRRKWEEVDPNIKSFVFKLIYDTARRIEDDLANELIYDIMRDIIILIDHDIPINVLCEIIDDIIKRLEKLFNKLSPTKQYE